MNRPHHGALDIDVEDARQESKYDENHDWYEHIFTQDPFRQLAELMLHRAASWEEC